MLLIYSSIQENSRLSVWRWIERWYVILL